MNELDFLKQDWKRQEADLPKVSIDSIYKMIHKRSSSLMKWILYVSVFEFVLWTLINLLTINTKSLRTLKQIHLYEFDIILTVLQYAVLVFFIFCFYKNYKEVQTTDNTRKLMKRILKVRRFVNLYVIYNLIMTFIIGLVVFFAMIYFDPKLQKVLIVADDGSTSIPTPLLLIFTGALLVFLLILWLFYKLLYGILLGRLNRNYKELNKLELRN